MNVRLLNTNRECYKTCIFLFGYSTAILLPCHSTQSWWKTWTVCRYNRLTSYSSRPTLQFLYSFAPGFVTWPKNAGLTKTNVKPTDLVGGGGRGVAASIPRLHRSLMWLGFRISLGGMVLCSVFTILIIIISFLMHPLINRTRATDFENCPLPYYYIDYYDN